MIQWDDSYKIGDRFIDSEHRILFEISEDLHKADPENRDVFKKTYLELMEYALIHFSHEEMMMEKINFTGLSEHKKQHHRIVQEMQSVLKTHGSVHILHQKLESLLERWISQHILDEDFEYKRALTDWKKQKMGG